MRTNFLEFDNLSNFKKQIQRVYNLYIIHFKHFKQNDIDIFSVIEQMEDIHFSEFFVDWVFEIVENIKYSICDGHQDICIIIAAFDIVFKYSFDLDFYFNFEKSPGCCNCDKFKKLQYDILSDCNWNISRNRN